MFRARRRVSLLVLVKEDTQSKCHIPSVFWWSSEKYKKNEGLRNALCVGIRVRCHISLFCPGTDLVCTSWSYRDPPCGLEQKWQ